MAGRATVPVKHPDALINDTRMGGCDSPTSRGHESVAVGRSVPVRQAAQFFDFTDINRVIDDSDNGVTVGPVARMRLGG